MEPAYQETARLILHQQPCVALTGAGISAESGIPTFRSKGGLWDKFDPAVYASIEVFRQDSSKYWSIRGEFIRNYDAYSGADFFLEGTAGTVLPQLVSVIKNQVQDE